MDALYRPTPVRRVFRVVQFFRLRSSPLMPSPGSDTWRCTRVVPDSSYSCFHAARIHATFDRPSGRHLTLCGVVQDVPVVFHCFLGQGQGGCFSPYAGRDKTGSWNTDVELRQRDMVRRELLIATTTFFTCGLLLQTGAQYSATVNTRACVEIRSVLAEAPQVVPARRRMSDTLDVTFPATSSRCCLTFSIWSSRTPRYFGACWNTRRLLSTNTPSSRLASLLLRW